MAPPRQLLDPATTSVELWGHNKGARHTDAELAGLAGLAKLDRLVLYRQPITRLPRVHPEAPLESVSLLGCHQLASLDGIEAYRHLTTLLLDDLPTLGVEEVFARLRELPDLTTLELRGDPWRELPAIAGELPSLRALRLRDCLRLDLSSTCLAFARVATLRTLSIVAINTRPDVRIPDAIAELAALEALEANRVVSISANVGRLSRLASLALDGTAATLPDQLFDLARLRKLKLSSSKLRALPNAIGRLRTLEELDINAPITQLPVEIADLAALHSLDLRWTRLKTLPAAIGTLARLRTLVVPNETVLPDEVYRLRLEMAEGPFDRARLPSPGPRPGGDHVLIRTGDDLPADLVETRALAIQSHDYAPPVALVATATALEKLEAWGSSPDALLAALPNPAALRQLDVRGVPGAVLGRFTELRSLSIYSTEVVRLPDELASLTCLRTLSVSTAKLSSTPRLASLAALTNLYVYSCDAALVDGFLHFAQPPQLSTLWLRGVANLDADALFTALAERPLTNLLIDDCGLERLPGSVDKLARLTVLTLEGEALAEVPPELARCTSLRAITVSIAAAAQLRKRLPPGTWHRRKTKSTISFERA